jgi:uncharacterized membrane protein
LSDPSPPAAPAPAPAATGRGLRWLLIASLALNLLVAGALAGLWLKGPPPHGPHRGGPSATAFGLMMFSRDLPPERREAVRKPLREARRAARPLREDMRAARTRAAEVLAAPDFTAEKLKAAMDEIGAVETRLRGSGVDALVGAVGALTPEERRKLSEVWKRRLEQGERRKGKQGRDGPGKDGPPDEPDGP